ALSDGHPQGDCLSKEATWGTKHEAGHLGRGREPMRHLDLEPARPRRVRRETVISSDARFLNRRLDRRRLLQASAATGIAATGMAAAGMPRRARAQNATTIRVAVYQEPARVDVQKNFIQAFEEAHPEIQVTLESADFSTYYTRLNTNLAAGRAP